MSHATLDRRHTVVRRQELISTPRRQTSRHTPMLARNRSLEDVFSRDVWWAELGFACAAIAWSLIAFFGPGDVTSRPAFTPLGNFAPPLFWETAGIIAGVTQVFALMTGLRWARWLCCFAMSWWWLLLGATIALNDTAAPSWGFYFVACAINTVSLWKLWRPNEL